LYNVLKNGDEGNRTPVQNGLKHASTSVDSVLSRQAPGKINPVRLSKAVLSDAHLEKSLDMLNSHPHTASCVVVPSHRQDG